MVTTPQRNYYQVLGITRAADTAVIKEAYHRLVRQYHPDLHPDTEDADARLKDVNEAYAVLIDPDERQAYDLRTYPSAPDHGSPRTPKSPSTAAGTDSDVKMEMAVGITHHGIRVRFGDRQVQVTLRQVLGVRSRHLE